MKLPHQLCGLIDRVFTLVTSQFEVGVHLLRNAFSQGKHLLMVPFGKDLQLFEEVLAATSKSKALFSVVSDSLKSWLELILNDISFGLDKRMEILLDFDPEVHELLF